jgi:hypothetical protein
LHSAMRATNMDCEMKKCNNMLARMSGRLYVKGRERKYVEHWVDEGVVTHRAARLCA